MSLLCTNFVKQPIISMQRLFKIIKCLDLFNLTIFDTLGQTFIKFFVCFFEKFMTSNFHSEINCPLQYSRINSFWCFSRNFQRSYLGQNVVCRCAKPIGRSNKLTQYVSKYLHTYYECTVHTYVCTYNTSVIQKNGLCTLKPNNCC